jgi:hypothetical protein
MIIITPQQIKQNLKVNPLKQIERTSRNDLKIQAILMSELGINLEQRFNP